MTKELALAGDVADIAAPAEPLGEAAFQEIYRLTAGPLWAYLYRLCGNAADADDLLQDAFCRLLRLPLPSHAPADVRPYLFRIASNLAVDHWRRVGRRREDSIVPPEGVTGIDPDLRHDVERIFQQLKPNERALLWLAYVEGFSHEEIAAALGLRPHSVRVLLFRARRKLAGLLTRAGFPGAAS